PAATPRPSTWTACWWRPAARPPRQCGSTRERLPGGGVSAPGRFSFPDGGVARRVTLRRAVVDLEFLQRFLAAGALQQDLHPLLRFLERRLAAPGEPNAFFELLHGPLQRQLAAFQLLDERLQRFQ